MTAERVGVVGWREERFDRREQDVHDFGLERAHDDGEPPHGCWGWAALASNASHPNDRWMVTYPRGS